MDDSLDPDDHGASLLPAGDHPPPGSFSVKKKKRNKLLPHEAAVICFFLLSQLTLTLMLHVHSHQSGPREGRTLSEMRGEGDRPGRLEEAWEGAKTISSTTCSL